MSKEKCVLAYSGGLDSTISIDWIQKNYGLDVVTLTVDLGSGQELEGAEQKAKNTGAVESLIWDVREEFVNDYILPTLRSGAIYEGEYLLSTAIGRPLMAKKLVEAANLVGAVAVAHGCTGKGNDQVRFDASIKTLALEKPLRIIAPAREWDMTRDVEKEYAQKLGIKPRAVGERVYSIDRNLWGLAIEGEDLEDTWSTPLEDAYSWTRPISKTPDSPVNIEIGFSRGTPVSLNGADLRPVALVEQLNSLAGEHGVGRIDHLENRLVGIKSREVYEMPAATVLHTALRGLETVVLARDQQRVKSMLAQHYADLVYDGRWYTALRENLDAFTMSALKFATGDVRVRLWKGTAKVTGRRSPHSLYSYDLATYSTQDKFDHQAALGFIDIYSLPARTQAAAQRDSSASPNDKL